MAHRPVNKKGMLDQRLPPHLRRIPSTRHGRAALPTVPPAPASHAAQGTHRPTSAAPPTPGQLCGFDLCFIKEGTTPPRNSPGAASGNLRVGVAGRLRGPSVAAAVVTAVVTAVMTTAMMRRAGVGARAAVRVLREDGTRAEDEREDENGCESEFLHWFSGSPLKEIGSVLKFVSVRRSRKQASPRSPPSSILD